MGSYCRQAAAAPLPGILAFFYCSYSNFPQSLQKNFQKNKNFHCIFEKMGYNKVE